MVKSRSFSSKKVAKKNEESIFFELNGSKFDCLPRRSGAVVLDAVSKVTNTENGVAQMANIVPFITTSVVEGQRAELTKVIFDDTDPIDVDTLVEVMSFLLESYVARPTEESSRSEENS